MRARNGWLALGLMAVAACSGELERPTGPEAAGDGAQPAVQLAAVTPTVGRAVWLAPLGTPPTTLGSLDATLDPVVEVCEWRNGACAGALAARFDRTSGTGGAKVTVASGAYAVDWNIMSPTLVTRKTYRIRVVLGGVDEGGVLVDVVRGRWGLTAAGTTVPLTAASAVPIRVWLGDGAWVGSAGGQVTSSGGAVARVPGGLFKSAVLVQLDRGIPDSSVYPSLSDKSVILRLAPLDAATLASGPLVLDIPVQRSPGPQAQGVVEVVLPGGSLWGDLALSGGMATLSLDASDLRLLAGAATGADLTLPLVPSEVSLATGGVSPGQAFAPSIVDIGPCTGLDPLIPPRPPHVAQCGKGTLVQLASGTDANKAIIVVHGWVPTAANSLGFYREQGLTRIPGIGMWLWLVSGGLPVDTYLARLLFFLRNEFPDVPIYGFTYESWRSIRSNGDALALALMSEPQVSGAARVAVVGHSMGGLVARYAAEYLETAGSRPDLIDAVVSLATPHTGTPAAAVVAGHLRISPVLTPGVNDLALGKRTAEGAPLYAYAGEEPDAVAAGSLQSDLHYKVGFAFLCSSTTDPDCRNDGIVPVSSAHPSFATYRRGPYQGYNHREMHQARTTPTTADPLYNAIRADLAAILAPPSGPWCDVSSDFTNAALPAGWQSVRYVGGYQNRPPQSGFFNDRVEYRPIDTGVEFGITGGATGGTRQVEIQYDARLAYTWSGHLHGPQFRTKNGATWHPYVVIGSYGNQTPRTVLVTYAGGTYGGLGGAPGATTVRLDRPFSAGFGNYRFTYTLTDGSVRWRVETLPSLSPVLDHTFAASGLRIQDIDGMFVTGYMTSGGENLAWMDNLFTRCTP